jgi:hypothetical protein
MSLNGQVSLTQPAMQGFGINGKQATPVGQRQESHTKNPFRVEQEKNKRDPRD